MDNDLEIKKKDFESLKIKARENKVARKFLDEDDLPDNPFFKGYKNTNFFNFEEGIDFYK